MTEAERQRMMAEAQRLSMQQSALSIGPPYQYRGLSGVSTQVATQSNAAPIKKLPGYSLAQVQLNDGSVVGMTISASPSLGQHLVKEMASTGYLYIFNEAESMMIKADRVVAVKLTKMTTE